MEAVIMKLFLESEFSRNNGVVSDCDGAAAGGVGGGGVRGDERK